MKKRLFELRQKWLHEAGQAWARSDGPVAHEDTYEARTLARCADDLGKAMEADTE